MRLLRLFVALLLAAAVAVALPVTAQAVDLGEPGPSYAGDGVRTPTADKAQSKLWFQDGSWWGLLWSAPANATKIHQLDVATQAWQETGTVVDARPDARGDALWDAKDGKLYVVSGTTVLSEWSSPPSQEAVTSGSAALHRLSYNAATKTYSRDAGFPVTLHSGSTESITLAKDSVGKLWVTYTVVSADNSNRVYVNHSTTSDTAWGTPFVLPTTNAQVHHDDISAVTSFQGDKIGIMWSNQRTGHKRFYLAVHRDGQPENSWQTEVAYGGGVNCTGGCANDHLNLRQLTSDGSGRLYAAIKTAHQNVGQTFVALLVRDSKGQWTSAQFGVVEDEHTRPMVMIDEEHRQVWMFAVAPEAGGTIYYKKTPIDNVSFPPGAGTPIISSSTDKDINDPTSTKQNVNGQTGLVVLAASRTNARYWHAYIDLGGQSTPPGGGDTTAPTVTAVSPADQAAGVAVSTNVTGTFSEAMNATTINDTTVTLKNAAGAAVTSGVTYDAASRVVTLDPNTDLAASTTYTASISTGVKDANGNALATAKTWSFTTAAAGGGGGTTETITVEVLEDSYVSSDATTTDYGSATVLGVDASPTKISYLKFDLGSHAGKTITEAKLQLRVTNPSTGSQRVKLVSDDWTESGIRYNSRPIPGTLVGTLTGATSTATHSATLDRNALTAELGHTLSLAVDSSSSDGLDFASSENTTTTNRPKLILTLTSP